MGIRARGFRMVGAAMLTASVVGIAAAPAAFAHDELISSTPADNAKLSAPPSQLVLKFSDAPLSGSAKIAATDATGQQVALGTPTQKGSTVTVAWPTTAGGGTYKAAWRVVSGDGHPITGTWSFSYTSTTPTSSASPTVPTTVPSPTTSSTASTSSGSSAVVWIVVVVGLLLIVAIAVTLVARRKPKTPSDS